VRGDGEEDRFRFLGGQTRGSDERVSIIRLSRLSRVERASTSVVRPSPQVSRDIADPFYVTSNNNGSSAVGGQIIFIYEHAESLYNKL